MGKRILFAVGLTIMLVAGFVGGWLLTGELTKYTVSNDAKVQAYRVHVVVAETSETFYFSVDDPLTKVLYWQSGGQLLAVGNREDVDWQMSLSHEDWPSQGKGDCTDVILKLAKLKNGAVRFEVACLGEWNKKVYFDRTILKLDTSTGARWKAWVSP